MGFSIHVPTALDLVCVAGVVGCVAGDGFFCDNLLSGCSDNVLWRAGDLYVELAVRVFVPVATESVVIGGLTSRANLVVVNFDVNDYFGEIWLHQVPHLLAIGRIHQSVGLAGNRVQAVINLSAISDIPTAVNTAPLDGLLPGSGDTGRLAED